MFDLIKAKYEPPPTVEMQEHENVEREVVRVPERNEPNYALLVLNLVLFVSAISLIVYGIVHLNDCPANKMIAVSYIVMGAIFFLSRLLNFRHEFLEAIGRPNVPPKPIALVLGTLIIQLIMLGWFFAACYWIYSIRSYINKDDPKSPVYCDDDYYKNIFWGSTIALIAVGCVIILTCGAICYIRCKKKSEDN